uniref:UDP-N-acetylglucosamine diphosphorylase n=1 Tax=Macrostomum lignano TaxID=282301 RepID=A0A1I8F3I1_9PLAT
ERGCLEHVRQRGLTCLQIFGVDNILTRVADPDFIGFCLDKRAEMGAKIVEKTSPLERVGVVTLGSDGAYRVVEYSEISASLHRELIRPSRTGCCCGLATSVSTSSPLTDWPRPASRSTRPGCGITAAVKRVPYCDPDTGSLIDSPPAENAIKLEKFVFDVFPFAGPKFVVWEVPSASSECPNTCRRDLLALHSTWLSASDTFQAFLQQNSKTDASSTEVEVSPLLSYSNSSCWSAFTS